MKPGARLTARPATANNGERLSPGVHHLRIGQQAEGYPLLYREFDGGHVVPPGVAEAAVWWFSAGGAGEVAG